MKRLQLYVSMDELNFIIMTLGKRPYEEVFQLIHKIQEQAQAQLQANQKDDTSNEKAQKHIVQIKQN